MTGVVGQGSIVVRTESGGGGGERGWGGERRGRAMQDKAGHVV